MLRARGAAAWEFVLFVGPLKKNALDETAIWPARSPVVQVSLMRLVLLLDMFGLLDPQIPFCDEVHTSHC